MIVGLILVLSLCAMIFCSIMGLMLLRYFLASESPVDDHYDFSASLTPSSAGYFPIWKRIQKWLGRKPKMLTYRRDRLGRFRRTRR